MDETDMNLTEAMSQLLKSCSIIDKAEILHTLNQIKEHNITDTDSPIFRHLLDVIARRA